MVRAILLCMSPAAHGRFVSRGPSLLIAHTLSTAALTLMNCQWIGQNAVRFLTDVIGRGIPTLVFAVTTVIAVIPIALSIAGWLLLTWFTWLNAWEREWLRSRVRELVPRPVTVTV